MESTQTPEVELDDILSEFSGPTLEEILKEFSVPSLQEAPEEPPAQEEPAPAPAEEAAQEPAGQEAPAQPAEPFSAEWEPEYEEPMGEFTPKAPIQFPPKTRLRQLRQKLVAGPERRYQALCEAGIGQLQVGVLVNFVLAALSVGATALYSLGLISPERLRTVIFCQLLLAMLAALTGCYRLLDGIAKLFKGRFTLDAALFITFLACIADGLLCLSQQRLSASSLFCLQMLMSQWGAYQRRNTELSQMDVLRKASELTAVVKIEDFWQGRPGYTAMDGEPEQFLDHYQTPSGPERALSIYGVISLLASVGLAVAAYFLVEMNAAIQVFMAAQLIALPFSSFVAISRPVALLQNRLHRLGVVLCGWQGIRGLRRGYYPLRHDDLFPGSNAKLNSVKFYGIVDPGRVVSYTTALLTAEGSGLLRVLRQLPRSRGGAAHQVENFQRLTGGIRGAVDGADVLIGTAECLQAQNIPMAPDRLVPEAIYTAVDGELSGVFAIAYGRAKGSAAGVRVLCGDSCFRPVLVTGDFLLTPQFIRGKLSVNVRRVLLPDCQTRQTLSQRTPGEGATVVALSTKPGLVSRAYALTGGRSLRGALRAGAAIHILGGIIGLAAVGVLAFGGGMALLTPLNLLLYSAVWALPGLLTTEYPRFL